MANDLASYRTELDAILATAVDSATWTTAIKDQALRHALHAYDLYPVYETNFTVAVAGHEQDLSGITGLKQVLGVYYPWDAHSPFPDLAVPWRYTDTNTVWIENVEPQVDDIIRVRYLLKHAIKDLDSAAATTVPTQDATAVATWAAGSACMIRARQLSENPAPPKEAIATLGHLTNSYINQAYDLLRPMQKRTPVWNQIGL